MAFDYKLDFIRSRYGRIARIYPLLELIFLLPRGIRSRTVQRLGPMRGDRILEVGCGTGRNFGHLVEAVGSGGKVYAVDCCEAMLAKAGRLCKQAGWVNVELLHQDAADLRLPELVAGVLFSLSYSVMPEPHIALSRAWHYLRPGKNVVVMDGKLARGSWGQLSSPFVTSLSRRTILGDPSRQPWEELRAFTSEIEIEEFNCGTYYICTAKKG